MRGTFEKHAHFGGGVHLWYFANFAYTQNTTSNDGATSFQADWGAWFKMQHACTYVGAHIRKPTLPAPPPPHTHITNGCGRSAAAWH